MWHRRGGGGALVVGIAVFLGTGRGWAMQLVYLDFDTFLSTGGHVYTPADRLAIKEGLEAIYPPSLGVTFTIAPTIATHSTVYFNFGEGPYGGTSDHVDFLNVDKSDDAYVLAKPLLGSLSLPDTLDNILRAGAYDLFVYRYTTIPEPATWALVGVAASLVPLRRRSR